MVPVVGTEFLAGVAVGMMGATVVAGTVICRVVTGRVRFGLDEDAGCGDPAIIPFRIMYTTTIAMTATAIIPIFFKRRRCFFFRTISLYRAGR